MCVGHGDSIVSHRILGQKNNGREEAGAQDQELKRNQILKMTVGKLRSPFGVLSLVNDRT